MQHRENVTDRLFSAIYLVNFTLVLQTIMNDIVSEIGRCYFKLEFNQRMKDSIWS